MCAYANRVRPLRVAVPMHFAPFALKGDTSMRHEGAAEAEQLKAEKMDFFDLNRAG